MAGGKASSKNVMLAERRQRALALRKTGATYRAIALKLGEVRDKEGLLLYPKYSEAHAHGDVKAALRQINEQLNLDTEEYRSLELERLDTAQLAIARQVQAGNLGAIDRWLRISERRAALLGLDAPVRLKIEQGVEAELNAFLDSLESVLPTETFQQVLTAIATVETRAATAASN